MVVLTVKKHAGVLLEALQKSGLDAAVSSRPSQAVAVVNTSPFATWVLDVGATGALDSIHDVNEDAAVIAVTYDKITAATAVFLIGKANELLESPSAEAVYAAVRRHAAQYSAVGFKIDTKTGQAWYEGHEFELTATRFAILRHMVQRYNHGMKTTYQEIAEDIYGEKMSKDEARSKLKTHIHYLRKDLEQVCGRDPIKSRKGDVFWVRA
jgi:DNA-binding response OmpR family regulator